MILNIDLHHINWREFATTQFWFAIDRSGPHPSDKVILLAAAVIFVLGILVLVYARFAKNQFLADVARRVGKIFVGTAILEALWYGLRYEYAQVLGTKAAAAVILLGGLIYLYSPLKYLITHYKTDMAVAERAASREKYLKKS
ncbi:MAG TPA: hypothetical protein VHQ41_02810 [Patescibacteria group bacterium]|jgi:hypothetical protein|nr:hypothetical protein [Patescibacteria group bacterium]